MLPLVCPSCGVSMSVSALMVAGPPAFAMGIKSVRFSAKARDPHGGRPARIDIHAPAPAHSSSDMMVSTVRPTAALFAALLSGIFLPFPHSSLIAQTLGSLAGTVSSGMNDAPLMSATVTVLGLELEAMTDEEGRFFLSGLPVGEIALRAELNGYASVVEQVMLTSTEAGLLQIRLIPVMATLSELLVLAGVGESSSSGSSDSEVLRDDNSGSAADLLATRLPGVNLSSRGGADDGTRIRIRGSSSLSLSNAPAIYVDGIRITPRGAPATRESSGLHVLDLIPANMVERIRILRGPAAAAYPDAAHGVILIETRGRGR